MADELFADEAYKVRTLGDQPIADTPAKVESANDTFSRDVQISSIGRFLRSAAVHVRACCWIRPQSRLRSRNDMGFNTIYFVMEGIFSIMFGLEHQRALSGRWGWLVLNGIIDLFLVGIIIVGLPGSALWVLGLLVGIDLVYGGSALIALSLTAHRSKSA
jgi:hypothetical protein